MASPMNKQAERWIHIASSGVTLLSSVAATFALLQGRWLGALLWSSVLLLAVLGGGAIFLLSRRPWSAASRPARLAFALRNPGYSLEALGLRRPTYRAPLAQPPDAERVERMSGQLRTRARRTVVFEDDAVGPMHRDGVPALVVGPSASRGTQLNRSIEDFLARIGPEGVGYVVTPSRMSSPSRAQHLYRMLLKTLLEVDGAAQDPPLRVVLRTDSCLRGHVGPENAGIRQATEDAGRKGFDLLIAAPAYVEQGRFTLEGVQYLQDERGRVRVDETEYAKFTGFEFNRSDIALWLEAKTKREIRRSRVHLVSLQELRSLTPDLVAGDLAALPEGTAVVFDIVNRSDAIAAACIATLVEESRKILYRAGPSLIDALTRRDDDEGQAPEFIRSRYPDLPSRPGLFVAGSLTSRTKVQLQELQNSPNVALISFDNDEIATTAQAMRTAAVKARKIDESLRAGHHAVLTTAFWLSEAVEYPAEHVRTQVLDVFGAILNDLEEEPGWIVFKGSDTGGHGLAEGLRAVSIDYLGPLFPGAGLVRLETTLRAPRFQGPVVLVAGNVGGRTALVDIVGMFEAAREVPAVHP